MARSPPACTHSTRMMPPTKLDMSNLAWENSEGELVLPPSPREGDKSIVMAFHEVVKVEGEETRMAADSKLYLLQLQLLLELQYPQL